MATDYLFSEVPVFDRMGVNLMLARNQRIDVLDTVADVVSPGLKQQGQPAPYVTTDQLGKATFTTTQGVVRLRSPKGLERLVYSPQYLAEVVQSALLINAPSDSVAAALVSNPGTATKTALDNVYMTKGSAVSQITGTAAVISKNLYNPNDAGVQVGFVLVLNSTGTTSASATYTTTGFIPVVAGQAYTISNPRNAVLYNASKAFVSQTDNAAQTSLTITPTVDGFLRTSFNTASYNATFQVEKGSTATSYVPFSVSIPGLDAKISADQAKATADAAAAKVGGITVSDNLFDSSTITPETLLSGSSTTPFAGYATSDFIPVLPSTAYTTKARHITWFTSAKTYIVMEADNPTLATVTRTAPSNAAYARIDTTNATLGALMFVKGSTYPGTFTAYGTTIAGLSVPSSGPVSLLRSGTSVTLTSLLGSSTIAIAASLARTTTNGGFNIDTTSLDGVAVHGSAPGDDVTPIRTQMGTVGANHGFTCVNTFTNPDGKTTADLGSKWTDGARQYVLLAIDGTGKLVMGGDYTTAAGVVSSAFVDPTVNLTHVSGATHTGAIDFTTKAAVGVAQLYPSVGRMKVTVWADGVEITGNGTTKARCVEVRESYEVLDYASLYDTAAANVGVSYTTLAVAGAVRVTNVFRFTAGGRCRVTSSLTELAPTTLGVCGFLQSVAMAKSGSTLTRYVPGVAPIGGRAWASGVDMTSYSANDIVTTGTLLTAGRPPAFSLDRLITSGSTTLGFAMGYLPWGVRDSDASINSARVTNAATNLWDLRSTKKSYPTVVASKAAGWGRLTVEGFRVYLTPTQTDSVIAAGTDALAAWARLDTVANLS